MTDRTKHDFEAQLVHHSLCKCGRERYDEVHFIFPLPSPTPPTETQHHVYEVYDAKDIDCTVFRHEQMEQLETHVWLLLDGLEDGESIKITHRIYSSQQLDELEDENG